MADQMNNRTQSKSSPPFVDALVSRALTVVAERNCKPNIEVCKDALDRLYHACADLGADTVDDVIEQMLSGGVSAEMISDAYIPLVARRMGDDWGNDDMNFANVTIGTARLQSSMRFLSARWVSSDSGTGAEDKPSVIVIVGQDVYHTLGAVVLTGQLRRMGLSVRLLMGATEDELYDVFRVSRYDAALISASGSESLESLEGMVKTVRQSASICPPIIIGGSILDQDVDVKALTGADFVTVDPYKALEFCGLKTNQRVASAPFEQRS